MTKTRKIFSRGLGLVAVGYAIGILTAPRNGKRTRAKLRQNADVKVIEKDLKTVYTETKAALNKLAKDNPKLSNRVIEIRDKAQGSQTKIKNLLSAIHGYDSFDEDLEASLNDAKSALKALKKYLIK